MHPMLGCVHAMPIPLHSQTRGGTPAAHKHLLTKPFNLKMKKFVIAVMAVFAMTFAACGNGQTSSSTSSNDSDTVAVDSADTIKADTTVVK